MYYHSSGAMVQLRTINGHAVVYEETDLSDAEADRKARELMDVIKASGLYVVVYTTNDYVKLRNDIISSTDAQ